MEIEIKKTKNVGYCSICKNYFRKGDVYIIIEKSRINKIQYRNVCLGCLLMPIAKKIGGWKKLIEIINKKIEKEI